MIGWEREAGRRIRMGVTLGVIFWMLRAKPAWCGLFVALFHASLRHQLHHLEHPATPLKPRYGAVFCCLASDGRCIGIP